MSFKGLYQVIMLIWMLMISGLFKVIDLKSTYTMFVLILL